jgi:hypothetical protein
MQTIPSKRLVHWRVDIITLMAIEELALQENRSTTSMANMLIKEALATRKEKARGKS